MWYDVKIKAALNGYMVLVGCQVVVYDSRKKLILDLVEYLDDPEKKAKEMQETGINRQWINSRPNEVGMPFPPPGRGGGFAAGSIDATI